MVCRRTVAMKKIANIMTMMMLSGVTLMTSSCQETKEERFEREAKEYTERKCPQKLDKEGVFVLDSMVFRNDGSRVMRNYYTIDTDSAGLRAFQDKKEEMRSLLLDAIINSADMRGVSRSLKNCVIAGSNSILSVFKIQQTGGGLFLIRVVL